MSAALRSESSDAAQEHRDDHTEEEAADVREERHAAAVRLGAEEPEVGLEERLERAA